MQKKRTILVLLSMFQVLFTSCANEAKPVFIESEQVFSEESFTGESKESEDSFSEESEVFSPEALNIIVHEENIEISGLSEEYELIFFADTHISLCDERDASLQEYMSGRYESFKNLQGEGSENSFRDIIKYVDYVNPDMLVMGGDITDAATWASVEYVDEILGKLDYPWIYEMGNHDFNYGAQEYFSEKSYSEYLPRYQNISNTKDGFQTVEYEDFIIFAVDDSGNQVNEASVTALKELVTEEKPIILISHVPIEPLEESTLIEDTVEIWGAGYNGYSKVLMGEHANKPNDVTKEFLELVLAEDGPVELVLSGHIHFYHKDYLSGDLQQIVTGPGYNKELLKITLIPEKNQQPKGGIK